MGKAKIQFRRSRKANAVLLETIYVRGDGAVQVRAVVPLEKARAEASSEREALQLAMYAAVGLAHDAASLAENKLDGGEEEEMSGFSIRHPFRRGGGRKPQKFRGAPKDKPEGGGNDAPPSDAPMDDAALDAAVAESDAARAANDGGEAMPASVNGSMGISFLKTAASLGVPGAGPTLLASKAVGDPNAGKTLARARKGDPRAKKKIHKIRKDAKNGDPEAQHALARLHKVNSAAKQIERKRRSFYDAGVS